MTESDISKNIQLSLPPHVRLFKNNTGTGWQGTRMPAPAGLVIMKNARPLKAGLCKGSSDLIGWTSITITPDMIGRKVAIFTAVEVKIVNGRVSPEQLNFIDQIRKAGGYAGIAQSPEAARKIIANK